MASGVKFFFRGERRGRRGVWVTDGQKGRLKGRLELKRFGIGHVTFSKSGTALNGTWSAAF